MISSPSLDNRFFQVYVTPEAIDLPAFQRALRCLGNLPITSVDTPEGVPLEHRNERTLFVTSSRGQTVGECPGSRGHICCNYLTVDLYLGCTVGCTYCIMKSYLNFSPLTVYADPQPSIQRIRSLALKNPHRILRVGTGETGDSLLLDPLFGLSREFIEGLSDLENVRFEMKTKTTHVDHLLDIPRKGHAVVAFSLNAPDLQEEEGNSAPIAERIAAASRASRAGYGVAFHFDPIIRFPGWKESYTETLNLIRTLPEDKIEWISLGTIRYPPALRDRLEDRRYLYDEFVPCRDGKYRYLQKTRVEIYRWFISNLSQITRAPVYLCMESAAVWKAVYGAPPLKIGFLRDIFTRIKFE